MSELEKLFNRIAHDEDVQKLLAICKLQHEALWCISTGYMRADLCAEEASEAITASNAIASEKGEL